MTDISHRLIDNKRRIDKGCEHHLPHLPLLEIPAWD
jgi:hypothetical protein